jgi:hypothetical protein
MKMTVVIASVFLGVIVPILPIQAQQPEGSQQIKQSVSKKNRKVAAHAGVSYMGQPIFLAIEETSISYAANTPEKVIHFGNNFYLFFQKVWMMSPNANGPWRVAPYIPQVVSVIECSQINSYPLNPYQLCAIPWTSGVEYLVWKPS